LPQYPADSAAVERLFPIQQHDRYEPSAAVATESQHIN